MSVGVGGPGGQSRGQRGGDEDTSHRGTKLVRKRGTMMDNNRTMETPDHRCRAATEPVVSTTTSDAATQTPVAGELPAACARQEAIAPRRGRLVRRGATLVTKL